MPVACGRIEASNGQRGGARARVVGDRPASVPVAECITRYRIALRTVAGRERVLIGVGAFVAGAALGGTVGAMSQRLDGQQRTP
jgi:hypothetical protein